MTACPICRTETATKYQETPYWVCPNCACWFQDPPPPKTYIAPFEGDPTVMSDGDKQVNRELAKRLFDNVMGGKPGRTLDIGAKLPVFAQALEALGCQADAMDAVPVKSDFKFQIVGDFESGEFGGPKYDFISLIHTFEHLYDPIAAIRKLRQLCSDDGAVFIRIPDHDVSGFERDLTPDHLTIHPYYHTLSSVLQCLYETSPTFVLTDSWILDGYGQRDMVLRPI